MIPWASRKGSFDLLEIRYLGMGFGFCMALAKTGVRRDGRPLWVLRSVLEYPL